MTTRLWLPMRLTALAQFDMLIGEVVQSLLDLIEDIRARASLVLVAQFEDHLAEPPNCPHRVVRIIFADRVRVPRREPGFIVAWQSSTSFHVRATENYPPICLLVHPHIHRDRSCFLICLQKRQQACFIQCRHLQYSGAIRL